MDWCPVTRCAPAHASHPSPRSRPPPPFARNAPPPRARETARAALMRSIKSKTRDCVPCGPHLMHMTAELHARDASARDGRARDRDLGCACIHTTLCCATLAAPLRLTVTWCGCCGVGRASGSSCALLCCPCAIVRVSAGPGVARPGTRTALSRALSRLYRESSGCSGPVAVTSISERFACPSRSGMRLQECQHVQFRLWQV